MMNIGIPKERLSGEERVGLTPTGIGLLTRDGHRCFVECGAGIGAGFADYDYERMGATLVQTGAELYSKSSLVLKVLHPTLEEARWMSNGLTLMCFLGLTQVADDIIAEIQNHRVTIIAYEMINKGKYEFPILKPMSEIAGRMAPYIAGNMLMRSHGGRGVLLTGVPGVSAGDVVILGAGTLGMNAARAFLGLGAKVFILSRSLDRLRTLDQQFQGRVTTMIDHDFNVAYTARFADVVIGAVRNPGKRAPVLITREMLRTMRKGSVILDFAIDHGGCAETSRPTTFTNPTYIEEGIVHYCVPNVPGAVPRTSTHAFNNAAWSYIQHISAMGTVSAVAQNDALHRGMVMRNGEVITDTSPSAFGWR
ncbi:MAG: alanine dehydrogenase [Anaerolineae bacterium]|nr:alanine dehydrogenase [Anaerolineae bacterium]